MVVISHSPALSAVPLQLFYAIDTVLSNAPILAFYGPSSSNGNQPSSSYVQSHIFTPAGLQSYPRLAISPASTLYNAVHSLPREEQGDEVCRALAFSLLKYFNELPDTVKETWIQQSLSASKPSSALQLFSEAHAADLASRMVPVSASSEITRQVEIALATHRLSHLDVDVVLPKGSIKDISHSADALVANDSIGDDVDLRYGDYASLIDLFGESAFLPTSRVRRAPSRPTAANRFATFTKSQKENLRREMCELVDTEERYVEKLYDMVHNVADKFREKAKLMAATSSSPDESTLDGLFPGCLDEIQQLNTEFYNALRSLLEETSQSATEEINSTADDAATQREGAAAPGSDPLGVVAFAKTLLLWFPKFESCYTAYIQAQADFGHLIKKLTRDPQTSFSQRVQETGEQRLMSMLIEPVQRLPRYALYIDNIVKQMPMRHPALKQLLKAKDTISDICSQDREPSGAAVINRIRQLIPSWPINLSFQGRFITAVDADELSPPYHTTNVKTGTHGYILMLFAGNLAFIKKCGDSPMSARSLVGEVDNPGSYFKPTSNGSSMDPGLLFGDWTALNDVHFYEVGDSNAVELVPSKPRSNSAVRSPTDSYVRRFVLTGPFDGKSARWTKDVAAARVEGRFSETERDSHQWEARCLECERFDLGLFAAVFEESQKQISDNRGDPASARIVIEPHKLEQQISAGENGVDIVASVTVQGNGFFRLDVESAREKGTRDVVTTAEFLPVLIKRLGNLLQMRSQMRNPVLTIYLLQHNANILKSLKLSSENDRGSNKTKGKRPNSPVKALANFFGGSGPAATASPAPKSLDFNNVPRISARSKSISEGDSRQNERAIASKGPSINRTPSDVSVDPIQSLEQTLSCYILALRARKGNVIGSVVSRRGLSDELAVNELYNALLENPQHHERAAQASIDVLFAAFDKFLNNAWQEKLGPVVRGYILSDLQSKMEAMNPFDYDEYAEKTLSELAPQNRRAFADVVALLSHLLDGMRNDADRGALTAAIAEIVVSDADPLQFIPMFDRLVENQETLAERPTSSGVPSLSGSVASRTAYSTNAGSIGSKASSLSRRLGFGSLRRENSKHESPSRSGSIMRFGSRKALPPEPHSEKPSLVRARSTDLTSQLSSISRPGSREPSVAVGSSDGSRPGTANSVVRHELNASSTETSPNKGVGRQRTKRRSSLSDLTTLQTPGASPFWTTSASKQIEGIMQPSPRTPSPTKRELPPTPSRSISARDASSGKKENTPPSIMRANTAKEASSPLKQENLGSILTGGPTLRPTPNGSRMHSSASSQDQVQKGILSERAASGNTPPPANTSPTKQSDATSPKKPRVQSPAKLRDRLEGQQKAVSSAESTLKDEMDKIAEELNVLNSRPISLVSPTSLQKREQGLISNLSTRLKALETKVAHLTKNLSDHSASLEQDLKFSLQASEKKAKALDLQLQQANAENDALYGRMNEELMRVFEQVKAENGVEELQKQLKDCQEEASKWKREAAKSKRENALLRAQFGA